MTKASGDSIAYPPRGLCSDEAARYVGVSTGKFYQMIKDGSMPRPKKTGGRKVWDRHKLDAAFTNLPEDGDNAIDDLLSGSC